MPENSNPSQEAPQASHVFEGKPDTRQSPDVAHKVSRFRPTYRALTDVEKALHDDLKNKAAELEALFAADGHRDVWLPKSMIEVEWKDGEGDRGPAIVTLPEWLAKKNELI